MTIDTKKTKATITSAILLSSIMMLTIQVTDTEYSFPKAHAGSFPAIIEGDILVGIEDLSGGGPATVLVNPTTGLQAVYTTSIHIIVDVKADASGDLIVAHEDGVNRIDTVTGGDTSIAVSGDNLINSPLGMDIDAEGNIILLDDDGGNGMVISVDPITGAETLVIIEAILAGSDDIAIDASGDILLLNGGVIYKVDPIAGTQTLFATDVMGGTDRMVINDAGDIFTAGFQVVKIDPITAVPTLISSGFGQISGIGLESDGSLIIVDTDVDPIVYRVDPISGAQTVVSSDNLFTGSIASTLGVYAIGGAPPVVTCQGQIVTIIGTEFADNIVGTPGDDVIDGLDGDDVINGLDGNDIICGGGGDDYIDAGNGNDSVKGNGGKDVIDGGEGNDVLTGNGGNDNIDGGSGNDIINGDNGDDIIIGGSEDDDMNGGLDNDLCEVEPNDTDIDCEIITTP